MQKQRENKKFGTLMILRQTDFTFLLFFTSAAILGSAGMGHYAAANHFLDALAHYRHSLNLPALSVNWGWWAGDGMATAEIQQKFTQIGRIYLAAKCFGLSMFMK